MEPVLQLISDGLGKFVNQMLDRLECKENSEPTERVESSETMESADSFEIAELSASSTQNESTKGPEVQSETQDIAECLVPGESIASSEPIDLSGSDQVMQFPDILKTATPSTAIDPEIVSTAGAPETVKPVAETETGNSAKNFPLNHDKVPEYGVRLVSSRYCQTGDQSVEAGIVESSETISTLELSVVVVNNVDRSQRPEFTEAAVQTIEVDGGFLPIKPAEKSIETSFTNSPPVMASESVTSSVVHESGNTFVAADSSGRLASPECAKTADSPTSSDFWTSVPSAPTNPVESLSAEAAKNETRVESASAGNPAKMVAENCADVNVETGGTVFTELTPLKNPAEQITAVELSSTSFTLEDNLLPDDDNSFYTDLRNWYDTNAVANMFDGPCSDQPVMTNYGDVSSTNTFANCDIGDNLTTGPKTGQKYSNDGPDISALLRAIGLEDDFESEGEQCKEPSKEHCKDPAKKQCTEPVVTEQRKESAKEQCEEPAVVPKYPAVVATSPDSTGDELQLRVLPCNIIVPRLENAFPQYAHLVRQAIKRKRKLAEDSALRKKFRTEIIQKIPLGSCKPDHCQPVSKPVKNVRMDDDRTSHSSKSQKSKKSKSVRHEPAKRGSKPKNLVVTVVTSPTQKADLSNYRIPKVPKLKIALAETVFGKKENLPQRQEASKRKSSDVSDIRGSPLGPKNPKVSPKRSDGVKKASLKHVQYEEPSSKHKPVVAERKDSTNSWGGHSSNTQSSSSKPSSLKRTDGECLSAKKPLPAGSQNHGANDCDELSLSDLMLPGMPELSEWEPSDFEVAKSQKQTNEKTSATVPLESDKVIHVHDFPKFVSQMVTYINSPERRENLTDPIKVGPSKCILKNEHSGLATTNRKVKFGENHSFRIIDCEDKLWCPFHCFLPEAHILRTINGRYSLEVKKTKLSSLKLAHRCHHPESRPMRSTILEPKFDCSEYIDKYDRSTFVEHIHTLIHSSLHRAIIDSEYRAETTNKIEFVIDVFDTSEKECWKIILKRKMDLREIGKCKVGDIVSLTLLTKWKTSNGKWKERLIFGYTEEVDVKVKGDHQIQKVSLSVHPIQYEVNRDQVKIQTVVNIGLHLRLLAAFVVSPHSEIVDLFTISSLRKLKAPSDDDTKEKSIKSEQLLAVDACYDGILRKEPFLYFVDGAPGTGKSQFIVKLVEKLCSKEELHYFFKILIVTQSHASADDIVRRLVQSPTQASNFNILRYGDVKTIAPSLKKYTFGESNYVLQKQNQSFDIDLEKRILEAEKMVLREEEASAMKKPPEANALKKKYVEEVMIGSADVVICSRDTCYSDNFLKDFTPCISKHGIFNKFAVVICDDANELSEIDLLVPVMTMASNLILIGDRRNPTQHDVSLTPFSQLFEKYQTTFPKNTICFETQFRVPSKIIDCLDIMKMNVTSRTANMESRLALKPLMIVDLPSVDESLDSAMYYEAQAKLCKNIVQNLLKVKELENLRIGVMVGKKKQKDFVKEELKSCSPETLVDKCAAYCGLEKDMIIGCMPTLLFPEKFLYTAMTRAKRSVIICGDFSRLQGHQTIELMLDNAKRRKCFQRWDKDPSDFPVQTMRLFLNKNNEVTPS